MIIKSKLQELVSNLGMDILNADTVRAIDDVRHGRIYEIDNGELILYLTRTGTHSDCFKIEKYRY